MFGHVQAFALFFFRNAQTNHQIDQLVQDVGPDAREQHRFALTEGEFALAERFADEWDQVAFDPDYDSESLEHFEPLVREVFAQAKML